MADAQYEVQIRISSKSDDSGAKQAGKSLDDFAGKATKAAAAVAAVGVVMKQAFDLSQEGARINDTRESFDRLVNSLGASPTVIHEMTAAVGGTVTELDAMQSTLTLLAGVNDKVGKQFLDNAPRLLEIAKAANKLNPSLGTTNFLFDSLARGIKRGSPLLIDNTGLIVKMGEANDAMAASLGKQTDELTAAEKQQATYNAVLLAGDALIKQVGGSVDAQSDSWARLDVQVSELTDTFKAWFADGIEPTIKILNGDYAQAIENTIGGNRELVQSQVDLIELLGRTAAKQGSLGGLITGVNDDIRKSTQALAREILENAASVDQLETDLEAAGITSREFRLAIDDVTEGYRAVHGAAIPTLKELKEWVDLNNEALSADSILLRTIADDDLPDLTEATFDYAAAIVETTSANEAAITVQKRLAAQGAFEMEQRAARIMLEREAAELARSTREEEKLETLAIREREVTEAKREQDEINRLFTERRAEQHTNQLEMLRLEKEAQEAVNAAFLETALDTIPMLEEAQNSLALQLLEMATAAGALSPEQFVALASEAGVSDTDIASGLQSAFEQQALQQAVSALGAGGDVGSILEQLGNVGQQFAPEAVGHSGQGLAETPVFESTESFLARLQSLFGTLQINVDARGASDPLSVQNAANAGATSAINAAMEQAGATANIIRRTR